MYQRGEHLRPHMHLAYAGFAASIALDDLAIIRSNLPQRQLKEAMEWIGLHQSELLGMWDNRMEPNGIYTIAD
jgi:hypothetical protein